MKKKTKKLSIAGLVTALVGGCTASGITSAVLNASTKQSTSAELAKQADYVEEDDLSNLPSDQDLGIMPAGVNWGGWGSADSGNTFDYTGGLSYSSYDVGTYFRSVSWSTTWNWSDQIDGCFNVNNKTGWSSNTQYHFNYNIFNSSYDGGDANKIGNKVFQGVRADLTGDKWKNPWYDPQKFRINKVSQDVDEGTMTIDFLLDVWCDRDGGNNDSWQDYGARVNLYGFLKRTTLSSSTSLSYVNSIYPSNATKSDLVTAIQSNGIVKNGKSDTTIEVTSIDGYNNSAGSVTCSFKVKNARDGYNNNTTLTDSRTFYGFKTYSKETTVSSGAINASDLSVNTATGSQIASKLAASNLIQNPWDKINSGDLLIDNIKDKIPAEGSLVCDITIQNSKATNSYGNPVSSIKYPGIKLTGFAIPTLVVSTNLGLGTTTANDASIIDIARAMITKNSILFVPYLIISTIGSIIWP